MVVIADKAGRLGNRLIVASHLLAAALEHGFSLAAPSLDEYVRFFPRLADDPLFRLPPKESSFPANRATRRLVYWFARALAGVISRGGLASSGLVGLVGIPFHERLDVSDPGFVERARNTRILLVQGWLFRDPHAVSRHRDRITPLFEPNKEVVDEVTRTVERARRDADILVGVHIRQGDYSWHLGGKYLFDSNEYARIMRSIEALFGDRRVRFLICSNEPQREGVFEEVDASFGNGKAIVDMYSLARCDYLVGAPSSFTLWASYYGRVPLYFITDTDARPTHTDFLVAPDIKEEVGSLY